MSITIEDLKHLREMNKKGLPLLSNYWEYTLAINDKEYHNNLTNETVSFIHNTSKYSPHSFYKPISTIIDLNEK